MNIELFDKVKEAILKEPAQFVMGHFFLKNGGCWDPYLDLSREIPNCGTAGCIAGHAIAIYNEANLSRIQNVGGRYLYAEEEAAGILQITESQANSLFYLDQWPQPFQDNWHAAATLQKRAQIAVARIDYFILNGV